MVAPAASPQPAAAPVRPAPTPRPELDRAAARVKEASRAFAKLGVERRIELLRQILAGYLEIAEPSVLAACKAKGLNPDSPHAGEEWLAGPLISVRNLRLLIRGLDDIRGHGVPVLEPKRIKIRPDGRVAVNIFPASGIDGILFTGFSCDVWLDKNVRPGEVRDHQARHYREGGRGGRVCLVLGAGNVASIPTTDVLYKLFVEGTACVLKMNPVNAYLGPFIERAFAPAIAAGYVAVVYGGGEEGAYLCRHDAVDEIHITGSNLTHDLIVWGPPGPERERRMAQNDPVLKKEITSELGNVTPVIVVPGPYSPGELAFQGANIAAQVTNNGSFNCNAAKLVVTGKGWAGRDALVEHTARTLDRTPPRFAYYPGADARHQKFLAGRSGVRTFGAAGGGALPWALVPGLDASDPREMWFSNEAFCGVLGEAPIGSSDPVEFLDQAVKFANQRVWGTLCATIVVHPKMLKDPTIGAAVDRAIENLRYGAVAVNHWGAVAYGIVTAPWGGAPGSPLNDVQSGRGWVHNTFMFDNPQKVVLWGPLKVFPKPVWFADNRQAHRVGRKLVRLEASPSLGKALSIAATAIRG